MPQVGRRGEAREGRVPDGADERRIQRPAPQAGATKKSLEQAGATSGSLLGSTQMLLWNDPKDAWVHLYPHLM